MHLSRWNQRPTKRVPVEDTHHRQSCIKRAADDSSPRFERENAENCSFWWLSLWTCVFGHTRQLAVGTRVSHTWYIGRILNSHGNGGIIFVFGKGSTRFVVNCWVGQARYVTAEQIDRGRSSVVGKKMQMTPDSATTFRQKPQRFSFKVGRSPRSVMRIRVYSQ